MTNLLSYSKQGSCALLCFQKVYELIGTTWTDRGTALCTGVYDEEMDSAAIVAKSEVNDVELLRSEIRASDVYQKQQGVLQIRFHLSLVLKPSSYVILKIH
jgi:protein phosphatase-4 regulatory subunit 3